MLILNMKNKLIVSLSIGLLLSASIETIQLVSHRGLFEFDDIVHNTIGTAIGVGLNILMIALGKKLPKKLNDI